MWTLNFLIVSVNLPVPEFCSKESDGKENKGIRNNEALYTIFNKQQTQFKKKMQKAFVDSADLKLFTINDIACMTLWQHLQQLLILSEQNSHIMEIKPCYDQEKADDFKQTAYPDDYLFHFSRNIRDYSCILKYDNY